MTKKQKDKINNSLTIIYSDKNPFDKCYKIYNDGGHFIARPIINNKKEKYKFVDINCQYNEIFDNIYFQALKLDLKGNALFLYIKEQLLQQCDNIKHIDEYIEKRLKQKRFNYFNRIKRLRRKANLNYWNYWLTFTYDDKKHTETSFRLKLRKCLSNLHTRYGWKIMGVFELSPTENRLHFHAIAYIPKMIGNVCEKRDYSTKLHKMQTYFCNDFFETKFGRNDFVKLNEKELQNGNLLEYLVKYINKTNEKIVYSRGIPTEIYKYIDNKDIAVEMFDFVCKYVLFDDVIDCKTDIMGLKYKQASLFDFSYQ